MREQVQIWWADLRNFDSRVPELQSVLSVQEQARAGKFLFLRDRNHYIVRHGLLRMLLGDYAGKSPSSLCFRTGTHGKPELQGGSGERRIHFNLSLSGNVALYGITRACPIGVDVECVRAFPDYERVAREFLSPAECKSLKAIREELRTERFFELWTRREALLKATGEGLIAGQLRRVGSQLEPAGAGGKNLRQPAGASADWQVRSFSPVEGYLAAVALGKANVDFICRAIPAAAFLEIKTGSDHQPFKPGLSGAALCRAVKR